jgi:uncharacterized membrane protein
VLADGLPSVLTSGQAAWAAALVLVTTVPWLVAGWSLLRHPRRAEALADLDA